MQRTQELMNPTNYPATATLIDAARTMRDTNVGDVLVERNGIVTDRDMWCAQSPKHANSPTYNWATFAAAPSPH